MELYCHLCGTKMILIKDIYYCPECGEQEWIDQGEIIFEHDDSTYEDIYCSICDSDCFPACKDGCNAANS